MPGNVARIDGRTIVRAAGGDKAAAGRDSREGRCEKGFSHQGAAALTRGPLLTEQWHTGVALWGCWGTGIIGWSDAGETCGIILCFRRDGPDMGEVLLRARKFSVERRTYDVSGRDHVTRELVVHPGAVLIVPMLDRENVVMIRNYRFSVGEELLELPAGTLEAGEPPAACAGRELEEETGYVAGRIEPLCRFYTSPGFTNELMHVFVATDLTLREQKLEPTEQIRVEPMLLADALAATTDGRIVDGKTIAALQVYQHRMPRTR